MKNLIHFILGLTLLFYISSCKKPDEIDPLNPLTFSTDTLFFDTIFSSIPTTNKKLIVYNKGNSQLTIDRIHVGAGSGSAFKTIINGQETDVKESILLNGGDSLYILVSVNLNPQNNSNPYIVTDSIVFSVNQREQKVHLKAYARDAIFINNELIGCNTIWTSEKPYVIYNSATVPTGCSLTIEKGVKVYFHENAELKVEGTLIVNGDKDSIVSFAGDKLSKNYEELAGQWKGITFKSTSSNNKIAYAFIKNAKNGLYLEEVADVDTIPELTISNSLIKNMSGYGVVAYATDVYLVNTVITNCVKNAFAGLGGGNYNFDFCTLANYSYDFFREDSALYLSDHIVTPEGNILSGALKSYARNTIVWGSLSNELRLVTKGVGFNFSASHCILKTSRSGLDGNSNLVNTDPKFVRPVLEDFSLDSLSPGINTGVNIPGISTDHVGKVRDGSPDIGAYEM